MRKSIIRSGLQVLEYMDNPNRVIRDSLIHKIGITQLDPTFDPIQNDLISSGNLRLIQNQKLKVLLSNWTSDIIAVQENEISWQSLINNSYVPLTNRIGISREIVQSFWNSESDHDWTLDKDLKFKLELGESNSQVENVSILENRELEGMIAKAIAFNQATNIQSFALENRIIEILNMLEQEIK